MTGMSASGNGNSTRSSKRETKHKMSTSVTSMEFDKRKGFHRGMTVRFANEKGSGTGVVAALHHASAVVAKDDGQTVRVRYMEMTRI